ncbi:MAG: alpha/beta hydrolase family protein [Micropepsaceae bacterium]
MFKKLVIAILTMAAAASLHQAALAAPPVEAYGSLPMIGTVSISPSGKFFAVVQNEGARSSVKIYDATSLARVGATATAKGQTVRGLQWHSDNRLILLTNEIAMRFNTEWSVCRAIAINRDGSNPTPLVQDDDSIYGSSCGILSLKGPDADTILLVGSSIGGINQVSQIRKKEEQRVVAVNINSNTSKIFDDTGNAKTVAWLADHKGRIRIRIDAEGDIGIAYARLDGSSDWVEVHRQPLFAYEARGGGHTYYYFLGFGADPNQVYIDYSPAGRDQIGVFDLRTRKVVASVASDPKYDAGRTIELRSGRIVGASIGREVPEQIFFSDDWRQLQTVLKSSYPGHNVQIVSSSDDLNRHVIYMEGPDFPAGAYQIVDLKTSEATMIGSPYPNVPKGSVGQVRYVTYTARDGMKIDAYLTMPPGRPATGLPAVVLPHGGPAARDDGSFEWMAQFLASRGYAVLQPQYRGSTGYGYAFARAGEQQWGLKMQDDVSDGVKYLTANGIADANRICIAGWSYGGYATMAGVTLTPELYKCGMAGAGLSDLVEFIVWAAESGGWKRGSARYWKNHIGDLTKERRKLETTSPAKIVKNVRAPLLLLHGDLDVVVPIKQSEIMADAMKAAGKPHEFVRLVNEDHYMSFTPTRVQTLRAMEAFLLKHNPPN